MAHKSNKHHGLSPASRAKISRDVKAKIAATDAREKVERAERKAARDAAKELKHLEHEQMNHGYTAAEKRHMGEESRKTEESDRIENEARARVRYDHAIGMRTYRPPHRRNPH
jgi:hypothetical protein